MEESRLPSTSRRNFIKATGGLGVAAMAGWSLPLVAKPADVIVVTSYPDEVVSRFEAVFEKAFPQWRLRIVWHMPYDALPTLRQPGPEGVDVYWTPSPRNFAILKNEGLLRMLDIDRIPRSTTPTATSLRRRLPDTVSRSIRLTSSSTVCRNQLTGPTLPMGATRATLPCPIRARSGSRR